MIEHAATWKSVEIGHYIQDKKDNAWRVTEFSFGSPNADLIVGVDVHLAGADGKVGRIARPDESVPVTILILNTQELLEHELGAKEVSS